MAGFQSVGWILLVLVVGLGGPLLFGLFLLRKADQFEKDPASAARFLRRRAHSSLAGLAIVGPILLAEVALRKVSPFMLLLFVPAVLMCKSHYDRARWWDTKARSVSSSG